jgi:spermidine synthase
VGETPPVPDERPGAIRSGETVASESGRAPAPFAAEWMGRSSGAAVGFAVVLFILSGAAALVYQVAWQRLLALTTGVAVHSIAIITAAFMAGLGIGSHLGGVLSSRLSRRQSLLAFAAIELAVAVFATLSVPFYYHLLYEQAGWLYAGLTRATLTHFASLLAPTALMGMSLPLLVRGLVWDRASAPRTIGLLYGANALGAAAGAFLTPWVLLRYLGVVGAVCLGAAGSAAAALGAAVIARSLLGARSAEEESPAAATAPAASADEPAQPFGRWVALYALSGFVSLALEMAWFRVLDVAAKGAAFTFGTLLGIYLVGLAGGTFAASLLAARVRRPLAAFLSCQVGIVLTTLVAHAAMVWLPADWPIVSALVRYGTRLYGLQMFAFDFREFLAVYVAMPLVLLGPSTFLMGFGFPILQRATQAGPLTSGRRVGLLQAANIAGCTLGSLLTGLVLFDAIGTAGVFRALALLSAAVALVGWRASRRGRFVGLAAALLMLAAVFPTNDQLWLRLHGAPRADASYVEEDAATVTALTPKRGGYNMAINGRAESWLPYGYLHTVIGGLPAIVHSAPEEVAVIGLGSGDTAWSAACRAETRRATVFEIASNQPRLLWRVADEPRMRKLRDFLTDPRVEIVKDDGRRRLRAEARQYDIIVADSVDPDLSLATYIFSVEHYSLVRDRLKPGGLCCVYARTPRIRAAIQRVFPFAVALGEDLRIASMDPIPIDKAAWTARLQSPRIVDYIGSARTRLIAEYIEMARPGPPQPPDAEVNRDLLPLDEFARPPTRQPLI